MKERLRDEPLNVNEIGAPEGRTSNSEARDQCRLGNLYASSGIYEYAVQAYKRAIQIDPSYVIAHHNLGVAYYKMGLFDEAISEFNLAIKMRPDIPLFHYALGLVLKDDRKFEESIESFSKAIELDQNYLDAYYRRGCAYFYIDELQKAEADLQEVSKRDVKFHNVLYNLGIIYFSMKRWEESRSAFSKHLELYPNDADAHYCLALICLNSENDTEGASFHLHKALQVDPEHLKSRFHLALIYARERYNDPTNRTKAIEQLINIINNYDDTEDFDHLHEVYFLLGSLYDDDPDDIDLAIRAYEQGLILCDWSAETHNNLGVLYSKKGYIDKAIQEFKKAIELNPDYSNPYQNMAKIYFYQRNDEIIRDIQLWIDNDPENCAKILFNLMLALIDVGRSEACEGVYSKIHRIKNLIGVTGSKLRRIIKEGNDTQEQLLEILENQEKCYNEIVGLLGALKDEGLMIEMVDIPCIIKSVLSQIGFRQEDRGKLHIDKISCVLEFEDDLPKVKGDHRRLKEAFNNIIINALEAMNNSGILTIRVKYLRETSSVEVTFKDTGIGIAPREIDNIFKPGFTTKSSGSGFGLSIVNRIITDHKGEISVSSVEGEGTQVTLRIPVNLELAPIQTKLCMRPVIYEDPNKLISTEVDQIIERSI